MNSTNVCVIGTGYVGLVTGACLAEIGHSVVCVDSNEQKVRQLQAGVVPIFEPGLEPLVKETRSAGRLAFSTDLPRAVSMADVIFICVGTPPQPSGAVDLSQVESVAHSIGRVLDGGYKVIVNKSTVPVGSGDWVSMLIQEGIRERRGERRLVAAGGRPGDAPDDDLLSPHMADYAVVSNPEFLREGSAIEDMLHPDRIVVGSNSPRAIGVMRELYRPIIEQRASEAEKRAMRARRAGADRSAPLPTQAGEARPVPFVETDLASAEMIKYAANAFLATKISFINEMANICERVGANISSVAYGIGLDRRIGHRFLQAGLGWGGSCFHKDLAALTHMAGDYGYEARLLAGTQHVNALQRGLVVQKLQERLKVLKGKTVGLLGLSFKAHTDDVRDAPALTIAERLLALGVRVLAYDPVAGPNARAVLPELVLEPTVRSLARGADALVLVTEWPEFRELDFPALREVMRTPLLVDGRNYLDGARLCDLGFQYVGIGC